MSGSQSYLRFWKFAEKPMAHQRDECVKRIQLNEQYNKKKVIYRGAMYV